MHPLNVAFQDFPEPFSTTFPDCVIERISNKPDFHTHLLNQLLSVCNANTLQQFSTNSCKYTEHISAVYDVPNRFVVYPLLLLLCCDGCYNYYYYYYYYCYYCCYYYYCYYCYYYYLLLLPTTATTTTTTTTAAVAAAMTATTTTTTHTDAQVQQRLQE